MQQAARVSQRTAFIPPGELVEEGHRRLFTKPRGQADPGLHHGPLRLSGAMHEAEGVLQPEHIVKAFDAELRR